MSSTRAKHRRRDLIFLVCPINTCYTRLQTEVPEGVEVDIEEETWSFHGETIPISQRRLPFHPRKGLPIGVYDTTKFAHLQAMKRDNEDIVRGPVSVEG